LLPSSSALEHFGYCNDDWDGWVSGVSDVRFQSSPFMLDGATGWALFSGSRGSLVGANFKPFHHGSIVPFIFFYQFTFISQL
jgi:hypothetical protein